MNCGENQIILVQDWHACPIACGVRGVECELCEESLARRIAARNLLKLNEVRASRRSILMDALKMWLVPEPSPPQFSRPARSVRAKGDDSIDEGAPIVASSKRRISFDQGTDRVRCLGHAIERALRRTRPHAGNKLHHAEPRHPIARVLDKTQERQNVFDVSCVKKSEATEFHKRDVASGQLHF